MISGSNDQIITAPSPPKGACSRSNTRLKLSNWDRQRSVYVHPSLKALLIELLLLLLAETEELVWSFFLTFL